MEVSIYNDSTFYQLKVLQLISFSCLELAVKEALVTIFNFLVFKLFSPIEITLYVLDTKWKFHSVNVLRNISGSP